MKSEPTSGLVPEHWRLLTPEANASRTSADSEATVACDRWCRSGRMKVLAPVDRTLPVGPIVIWKGSVFPPPMPNSIRIGLARADAGDAAYAASAVALTASRTILPTSEG
jgi:hypothetical protein